MVVGEWEIEEWKVVMDASVVNLLGPFQCGGN